MLLIRIRQWLRDTDAKSDRFFGLLGVAGEGKSAVASSVANWIYGSGKYVGASFSLSPEDSYRSHTTWLFRTLAILLARRNSIINKHVCRALQEQDDATLVTDEFERFLRQPLLAAEREPHFSATVVILLDGIDVLQTEHTQVSAQGKIHTILSLLDQLPAFVRIFFTSRPHPGVKSFIESMDNRISIHQLIESPTILRTKHSILAQNIKRDSIHT